MSITTEPQKPFHQSVVTSLFCVLFLLCFEIHWWLCTAHIPYARNEYYGTGITFKTVSLTHKCMLSAELLCLVGNFPFIPLLCGGSVPFLCAGSPLPAAAVHWTTCSRNSHQVTHPQPLLLAGTSAAAAWVTGRIEPPAASLMLLSHSPNSKWFQIPWRAVVAEAVETRGSSSVSGDFAGY